MIANFGLFCHGDWWMHSKPSSFWSGFWTF